MQKTYDSIYKIDNKNKVRIWYIEQDNHRYRTWDGTLEGKIKSSEWRDALPTNVGKANERDGIAQAIFEIEALYKKKLEKDYHSTIENAKHNGSHIFGVMLAEKYKNFQPGFAQPKLDGFRCIANKDGLWSRMGKPYISCPHIMEELAPLFKDNPNLILDGELYNHNLHDNFDEIQSLVTVKSDKNLTNEHYAKTRAMVQYHVYDIPSHPGTFIERWEHLGEFVMTMLDTDCHDNIIQMVSTVEVQTEEKFDSWHGIWLEQGYEGSMWRNNTPYENRRTKNLLKRKDFVDQEFELLHIEEGQGNWAGVAKSVYYKVPGAIISSGDLFVNPDTNEILRYTADVVPVSNSVRVAKGGIMGTRERGIELLNEIHHIVTVKYFQLTPDGVPRFGVATKFHGEKRQY